MATYIVGPTGAGIEDGSDWDNRLAGLNAAEDIPVIPGDIIKAGPGVYRETLACDVSGGNTYSTGTISVTKGSDQVIGNGTTFGGNVAAGYYFHIRYYDQGTDGITDGTAAFEATAGNFHANLVGCPIQINTLGAYTIAAVTDADNLTLADPNELGWPGADTGLTYSIMSGEGHHEIESQDDNTTLTLVQPWQGKTHTGLAYLTFDAITYIADVTGENTDSVGGVVRITGSDNDQTAARASCISANAKDYRVFRGFQMDMVSDHLIVAADCDYMLVEDSLFGDSPGSHRVSLESNPICVTFRRCAWAGGDVSYALELAASDDSGIVIENCGFWGYYYALRFNAVGGATVRNSILWKQHSYGCYNASPTAGQTNYFVNNIMAYCGTALRAQTQGSIIEDFNAFWENGADRNGVGVGASSNSYPPLLALPILYAGTDRIGGLKFPAPTLGELAQWSQIAAIAGVDERNADMYGIPRPATAAKNSWGPVQFSDMSRETTTVDAGAASLKLADAGVHQMWVPVANESTTITVQVYREANYAGTNPRMVIKQPGQADDVTTDAAAASQWNELATTLTPAADPPYVIVELQSLNTAAAGNFDVFFDTLLVT